MQIPAPLVMRLRERTGRGVLACRDALVAAEGSLPDAEFLLTGRISWNPSGPELRRALAERCGLDGLWSSIDLHLPALGAAAQRLPVHAYWIAEIHPAFLGGACLAVLATPQQRVGTFLIATLPAGAEEPPPAVPRPGSTFFVGGPLVFPDGWEDPVANELGRLSVWSVPAIVGASCDGRSYSLEMHSGEVALRLSLTNPETPSLLALEQALIQVAEQLAQGEEATVLSDYVRRWATYATS